MRAAARRVSRRSCCLFWHAATDDSATHFALAPWLVLDDERAAGERVWWDYLLTFLWSLMTLTTVGHADEVSAHPSHDVCTRRVHSRVSIGDSSHDACAHSPLTPLAYSVSAHTTHALSRAHHIASFLSSLSSLRALSSAPSRRSPLSPSQPRSPSPRRA